MFLAGEAAVAEAAAVETLLESVDISGLGGVIYAYGYLYREKCCCMRYWTYSNVSGFSWERS